MPYEISAVGTVTPLMSVAVRSQVTGILLRVGFREGEDVRPGQLLFQMDPRPFQVALDQARATLAKDRAQADNARQQVARYQELAQNDLASREQLDQYRANAAALDATLAADSAAVETAQLNLDYTNIRARIAGRTGALSLHEGNLVRTTDQTPLVVINQIRPIGVTFAVPQKYLADIQRYGASHRLEVNVRIGDSAGVTEHGVVSFVDNRVDSATGTVQLKATLDNEDARLWPGAFEPVRLVLDVQPHAVTVPSQAVISGQNGPYVFVLNRDRTVKMQPVTVGATVADYVVIAQGLEAGEQVITDGQLRLTPGASVEVKGGGAAAAAPADPARTTSSGGRVAR